MCRRSRSSRRRLSKNAAILRRITCSGSFRETSTSKSPICGSLRTRPSSSASVAGARSFRSFGSWYSSFATIRALRTAAAPSAARVPREERRDQLLLLLLRDVRQLDHVVAELELRATPAPARDPGADRADRAAEGGGAERDEQTAELRRL